MLGGAEINYRVVLATLSGRALLKLLSVEFFRLSAWNAERLPFARSEMLGQENDLASVLGVVRDLPIHRLQDGMGLAANCDRAHDVLWLKAFDGREHACPTLFPPAHDIRTGSGRCHFEFLIAIAVWLLAIGGQEVGEPRAHVARQMLDEDGDRIRLWIERYEQLFVFQLSDGALCQAFVPTELATGFIEIVSCDVSIHHASSRFGVKSDSLSWIRLQADGFLFALL